MSVKGSKTTCSGLEWPIMLDLITKLKRDGKFRQFLLIGTGCYFGLRGSDLLNLKWNYVLDKDEFTLFEQKTGKLRVVSVNPHPKEMISYMANKLKSAGKFNPDQYLFTNYKNKRISIQSINEELKNTFQHYNVKKVGNGSTHTLRKTFGKRVWEQGGKSEAALIYLSEIFGHSNIGITKRYIGIIEEDIKNIYFNM